jgi:hypothetical protein
MSDGPRPQRDVALLHLESLIGRGRELQSSGDARADDLRAWQQQCGAAITHLSGGSKAHWLSRAFSEALLVRSIDGGAVVEAPAAEIVRRVVDVLMQARTSLLQMDEDAARLTTSMVEPGAAAGDPQPRRFAFVHHTGLRPVLERTFADSRAAFDRGDFALALVLACGVLESIITDALEHAERRAQPGDASARIAAMPFAARIAAAEGAGLIRGGCARLPPIALRYRELLDAGGALRRDAVAIARDARTASQVLRVVMRDLDPGR